VTASHESATGLSGVLVVDKPAGPSSHDIVALVRRLAGTRRIGHGGTLDPFASGVLPLFLGHATRLVEYHAHDRKAYRATVCFGASSTTDDLEGDLTPADGAAPERGAVDEALASMVGEQTQRPPAYSAIKVAGRRAYARARAGERVEIPERTVTIHELAMVDWDTRDPARPVAVIDIVCSAGTYVRAIARDLGAAVGSAAYLGVLVRTASGSFSIGDAVALDDIRTAAARPDGVAGLLLPPDAGLDELPRVVLSRAEVEDVARGRFVRPDAGLPQDRAGPLRLVSDDGRLIAVALARGGRLAPDKVFVEPARG
jgi:tRNA pseudouridine55 synthase